MHAWQIVTSVIVAIIAVYGAVLSTINFLKKRSDLRPHVSISIYSGLIPLKDGKSEPNLVVEAVNNGFKKVILQPPKLILPDMHQYIFPISSHMSRYPCHLNEGETCIVARKLSSIASDLIAAGYSGKITVLAQATDNMNNRYSAKKPFKLLIDDWVNME